MTSSPRANATVNAPVKDKDEYLAQTAQLFDGCQYCISQCELLLGLISHDDFASSAAGSSIGTHLRHVLERFHCFFNGLPSGHIDYDARKRDHSIALSKDAAAFALAAVARRMSALACETVPEDCLSVQETVYHLAPAVTSASCVQRELMGLITHTSHHLAIIALLLKPMGYAVDQDFGKAASTIVFERTQQANQTPPK